MRQTETASFAETSIGYAAGSNGKGVVYARAVTPGGERVLRLGFAVGACDDAGGRVESYAALTVVARALHRRGVRRAEFVLGDEGLVDEIAGIRDVPASAMLAHLTLRCALNCFERRALRYAEVPELTQRARAEVTMHCAA